MKTREALAANFKRLMSANPSLGTLKAITKAGGGNPSNGTLDRINRAASAATVDTLDELAAVFGVETWQLLAPNIDKTNDTPSALAMELAYLFDDIVAGMGPRDRSIVYQAAQEAITRPIARHAAQPSDTPAPPASPRKQRA